jgi:hypothetical protein
MRDACPQRLEFDAKAEAYESNRLAPWYQAQGDQVPEQAEFGPIVGANLAGPTPPPTAARIPP